MTPLTAGFKLWTRAVALNALAFSLMAIPDLNIFAIAVFIASLLLGLPLGSPLIIVFSWLIKVFVQLPYDFADKFAWLVCALVAAMIGFWAVALPVCRVPDFLWLPVSSCSSIAVLIATFWSASSIKQLNYSVYEQGPA